MSEDNGTPNSPEDLERLWKESDEGEDYEEGFDPDFEPGEHTEAAIQDAIVVEEISWTLVAPSSDSPLEAPPMFKVKIPGGWVLVNGHNTKDWIEVVDLDHLWDPETDS